MKRSNRLVILVGVLLAVLAFVGIVVVLNNAGTAGPSAEAITVNVLVATEDIAIGDPVTPDKVEIRAVDPAAVVGTRLADPSQVGGRPSLFNVPRDTQVSAETIGVGGNVIDIAGQLAAGERAVGFQVDRITGLDFLVKPGDHIDVVLTQRVNVLQPTAEQGEGTDPDAPRRWETIPGLESAPTVKVVIQNRRVLYVSGQRVEEPEPVEGEAAPPPQAAIERVVIIFAGTDQDSEIIKLVQNDATVLGDLTAVVRSPEDHEAPAVETIGITLDVLVDQFGVLIPDPIELQQEAP